MAATASLLPRLVLRADGNAQIGLGHVMRLLALADMLRDAFATYVFATRDAAALTPLLNEARLTVSSIPELSGPDEAAWLRAHLLQPTDVVVLDGYHFPVDYQSQVRAGASRLVYVDDLRAWPVVADVLINHSPGITPSLYQLAKPATQLLLGPAYSLLRPEFIASAAPPRPARPIQKLLLCFGGADPLHLTARCLKLLLNQPTLLGIGLLVGHTNPDGPALQRLLAAQAPGRCVLHAPAGATQLVSLLHYYDAIVCPASTILIESLLVGTAALTGYYADNQHHLGDFVHAHQQAYSVGNFARLNDEELQQQLLAGLLFLEEETRHPYVSHLRTTELRSIIAAPLPKRNV